MTHKQFLFSLEYRSIEHKSQKLVKPIDMVKVPHLIFTRQKNNKFNIKIKMHLGKIHKISGKIDDFNYTVTLYLNVFKFAADSGWF
jgi:hypothetical protein